MKIQILGTGCKKCQDLADLAARTATDLGLDFELVKVTEIAAITAMGVMSTPAMALDGVVKLQGKLPDEARMRELLENPR